MKNPESKSGDGKIQMANGAPTLASGGGKMEMADGAPTLKIPEVVNDSAQSEIEQKQERDIRSCTSFDMLFGVLRSIEKIEGSQQVFSGTELEIIIRRVRDGDLPVTMVTKSLGLRDAVIELLDKSKDSKRSLKETQRITLPPEGNPSEPVAAPRVGAPENSPVAPEAEATMEQLEAHLDEMRELYVYENKRFIESRKTKGLIGGMWQKLRGIKPAPEGAEPPELIDARETYNLAKVRIGKKMLEAKKERLMAAPERFTEQEIEAKLKVFKSKVVFERVVLDEHVVLEKAKQESWTPKEQGVFFKGLKWYGKQHKLVKIAIGSMVAVGGATIGGLSAPATALFAGSYALRAAIAAGVGFVAGKGFEKFVKNKSEDNFTKAVDGIRKEFGTGRMDFGTAGDYFRGANETKDKENNKYNLAKNLVIGATGAWTSIGIGAFESFLSTKVAVGSSIPGNLGQNIGQGGPKIDLGKPFPGDDSFVPVNASDEPFTLGSTATHSGGGLNLGSTVTHGGALENPLGGNHSLGTDFPEATNYAGARPGDDAFVPVGPDGHTFDNSFAPTERDIDNFVPTGPSHPVIPHSVGGSEQVATQEYPIGGDGTTFESTDPSYPHATGRGPVAETVGKPFRGDDAFFPTRTPFTLDSTGPHAKAIPLGDDYKFAKFPEGNSAAIPTGEKPFPFDNTFAPTERDIENFVPVGPDGHTFDNSFAPVNAGDDSFVPVDASLKPFNLETTVTHSGGALDLEATATHGGAMENPLGSHKINSGPILRGTDRPFTLGSTVTHGGSLEATGTHSGALENPLGSHHIPLDTDRPFTLGSTATHEGVLEETATHGGAMENPLGNHKVPLDTDRPFTLGSTATHAGSMENPLGGGPRIPVEAQADALTRSILELKPSFSLEHVVGPKDNIWSLIKADMAKNIPGFNSLSGAAKNNAIDTMWQKFVHASPSQLKAIGIASGDPHILANGSTIRLGEIMKPDMMDNAVAHAYQLTAKQLAHLNHDSNVLRHAFRGYHGAIREPLVNKILAAQLYTTQYR